MTILGNYVIEKITNKLENHETRLDIAENDILTHSQELIVLTNQLQIQTEKLINLEIKLTKSIFL